MFRQTLFVLALVLLTTAAILAFLSQRYWFMLAWRLAGGLGRGSTRRDLRLAMRATLVVVAATAATLATAGYLAGPRWPLSWWKFTFGAWLVGSTVAYLLVQLAAALQWLRTSARPQASSSFLQSVPSSIPQGEAASAEHIDHEEINQSRRYFFQTAGVLAGALPVVSAAYGFVGSRLNFHVREAWIPIANLPEALDGLRIAQLSDIHAGAYMPVAQVRRAVDMANELNADLVVLTGDLLTGPTDPLEQCVAELARLRAPLGVWGCNGNHEIYARAEAAAQALFAQSGMKLLRQENAEVRWRGGVMNLIGVDYQRQGRTGRRRGPMLAGVEELIRPGSFNVLLSHNPNTFVRASQMGIDLTLAGHTHGGQVRVEILDHRWNPAEYFTPYVAGLYQKASSFIYVNRGLGTIGAPVRLGVPPEITLLTLRRA